jgi:hypothetical protein
VNVSINTPYKKYCEIFERNATRIAFQTEWHLDQVIKYICKKIPFRLPEDVVSVGVSIFMTRNHYLYHIFEEVMQHIIQAGIPEYLWYNAKWIQYSRFQIDKEPQEPYVFSVGDLSYGFQLWLASCGVCVIVFFGELAVFWIPKLLKRQMRVSESTDVEKCANNDDALSITSEKLNDYVFEVTEVHQPDNAEANQEVQSQKPSTPEREDTLSLITEFEQKFCADEDKDDDIISLGSLFSSEDI